MLTVRILVGLAGSPYQPGEVLTLPDDIGKQMVREQRAELLQPTPSRAPKQKG